MINLQIGFFLLLTSRLFITIHHSHSFPGFFSVENKNRGKARLLWRYPGTAAKFSSIDNGIFLT